MTKPEELLKGRIDESFEDTKIEITQELIDNALHLCTSGCLPFDTEDEIIISPKKHVVKTKMTKKTQLEQATQQLYDLESCHIAEETMDVDLGLYQMEDY
ncbi:MAG: hypothetical protein FWF66_02840 [Candidatus Bathyarchaeota archaeon]|jgi:hypothetical protein|nr:hypothetical protein [Candidatus Termiticorpusculum sp.]MCL1970379.1 hypothetical protein [Candidatus Termiticorpusculum sp.]